MKNKNLVKYTLDQIINNPHLLLGKFEYYYNNKPYSSVINYYYKIDKNYIYFSQQLCLKKKSEFIFHKIYIHFLKKWFDCKNVELF